VAAGEADIAIENYNNPYDKFATRMQGAQEQTSAYPTLAPQEDDEIKVPIINNTIIDTDDLENKEVVA